MVDDNNTSLMLGVMQPGTSDTDGGDTWSVVVMFLDEKDRSRLRETCRVLRGDPLLISGRPRLCSGSLLDPLEQFNTNFQYRSTQKQYNDLKEWIQERLGISFEQWLQEGAHVPTLDDLPATSQSTTAQSTRDREMIACIVGVDGLRKDGTPYICTSSKIATRVSAKRRLLDGLSALTDRYRVLVLSLATLQRKLSSLEQTARYRDPFRGGTHDEQVTKVDNMKKERQTIRHACVYVARQVIITFEIIKKAGTADDVMVAKYVLGRPVASRDSPQLPDASVLGNAFQRDILSYVKSEVANFTNRGTVALRESMGPSASAQEIENVIFKTLHRYTVEAVQSLSPTCARRCILTNIEVPVIHVTTTVMVRAQATKYCWVPIQEVNTQTQLRRTQSSKVKCLLCPMPVDVDLSQMTLAEAKLAYGIYPVERSADTRRRQRVDVSEFYPTLTKTLCSSVFLTNKEDLKRTGTSSTLASHTFGSTGRVLPDSSSMPPGGADTMNTKTLDAVFRFVTTPAHHPVNHTSSNHSAPFLLLKSANRLVKKRDSRSIVVGKRKRSDK